MSNYSEERHKLLCKRLDENYDRTRLPEDNDRINELTILISEEKRIGRVQEALEEATEKDVIKFFGVKAILESIDETEIHKFLKNYCDEGR